MNSTDLISISLDIKNSSIKNWFDVFFLVLEIKHCLNKLKFVCFSANSNFYFIHSLFLKNVHPSFCYDSHINSYVFNTCKSAWFSKKCHIFSAHPFFMNYVKQYATCKDISHNFLQPTNIQELLDLKDRVYWGIKRY